MCSVSMVITDFEKRWPNVIPNGAVGWPLQSALGGPTRAEFDALRAEVIALRGLLEAAKKFDDATGQHDCEQAEKVALLKRVAELVGVDISDVLSGRPEGGEE